MSDFNQNPMPQQPADNTPSNAPSPVDTGTDQSQVDWQTQTPAIQSQGQQAGQQPLSQQNYAQPVYTQPPAAQQQPTAPIYGNGYTPNQQATPQQPVAPAQNPYTQPQYGSTPYQSPSNPYVQPQRPPQGPVYQSAPTPYAPQGMYYPADTQSWNTMCIVGFVLCFLVPPVGLILSIIALVQINKSGEKSRGMSIAGIVLGSIFTFFVTIIIVAMFWAMGEMINDPYYFDNYGYDDYGYNDDGSTPSPDNTDDIYGDDSHMTSTFNDWSEVFAQVEAGSQLVA